MLNSILQHSSVQNETSIISSRVEDVYDCICMISNVVSFEISINSLFVAVQ